jgi:hypothetical protein
MAYKTVGEKPQTELLLAHLQQKKSITGIEASALFKVRSLTRRITDLKELGHSIRSEWRRDSTGQRYVRYHYQGI